MSTFRFTWTETVKMAIDVDAIDYADALDTFYNLDSIESVTFLGREFTGVENIEELTIKAVT